MARAWAAEAAEAAVAREMMEDEWQLDGSEEQSDAARLMQRWYRGFLSRRQTGRLLSYRRIPPHA